VDGRKLVTLRDAGEYIAALPRKAHDAPEWQAAIEALILVAERCGVTMFARISIHAGIEPTLRPSVQSEGKRTALGPAQAEEESMTGTPILFAMWKEKGLSLSAPGWRDI
jgi:hypothetical protein